MPRVSVVVPCYRYGRYVTGCLTSVLANTQVDLDILVIDDASPDDSWSIVRRLPELDPRIRVHRNEQNRGLIATANSGVLAATGDYVVLLSADDLLAPGWLDRGVAQLEANPRAVLAYGPTRLFRGEPPTLPARRGSRPRVLPGRDFIAATCASGINFITCPEAIARTSAHHEVGGYRADLPYSSDMELWLRLASVGDVIRDRGDYAAYFRVSPSSMSANAESSMIRVYEIRRDAFNAWHEFARDRVPGADDLLAAAHRRLARQAVYQAWLAFPANPIGGDAELLVKFALDTDPEWATGAVRRMESLRGRQSLHGALRGVSPLSYFWFRGHRGVNAVRRRLKRFSVN